MPVKKFVTCLALLSLSGCAATQTPDLVLFEEIQLGPTTANSPASGGQNPSEEFAVDSVAKILIRDQTGEGEALAIDQISVGRAGTFLVIYDGKGLVIASVMVSPQGQPVYVRFDEDLDHSQALQAAMYLDNGDAIFDLTQDTPIVDSAGALVHADFYYTVEDHD